ncbi:hypothetical protein ANPL_03395 [Anaplasma platys]|uniref:Uncharacterized protein n=1 Tax=Anaplasma platys TaxID=949 RepID=A0A858PYU1_9RICK|nr:hypothetical protein ANPL_03395 [Anaplasma platys]
MNSMKYYRQFSLPVFLAQHAVTRVCRCAIRGGSLFIFPSVCIFLGVKMGFIAMTPLKFGILRTVFGEMLSEKTLLYATNFIVVVSYCLTSVTDCL